MYSIVQKKGKSRRTQGGQKGQMQPKMRKDYRTSATGKDLNNCVTGLGETDDRRYQPCCDTSAYQYQKWV